jgi:hypothetical protein
MTQYYGDTYVIAFVEFTLSMQCLGKGKEENERRIAR